MKNIEPDRIQLFCAKYIPQECYQEMTRGFVVTIQQEPITMSVQKVKRWQ